MNGPIPIRLAVEDELSEWVVRRVLAGHVDRFAIGPVFGRSGFGYLKRNTLAFNNAARGCPILLLTDLDRYPCPPELLGDWLPVERHRFFLLRVAVREVESWLLGDALGLGSFLRLRNPPSIADPEALQDPKHEVLTCALRSPSRWVRESLVWRDDDSGQLCQGPDYNGTLSRFVNGPWNLDAAKQKCRSLARLCAAVERLAAEHRP
jgi:hypothetical protein